MSSNTPLRERLPANSPNPSSSSNQWPPQSTTPLRISKRDSPQQTQPSGQRILRRQSLSYKSATNGGIVSKSPFRQLIPSRTPSAGKSSPARPSSMPSPSVSRRVSGEKRPRTSSMQQQAENEHPLGFKRRQSRGFQGLMQKESVSKSPFKKPSSDELRVEQPHEQSTSPRAPKEVTRGRRVPPPAPDPEDDDQPPTPPPKVFGPHTSSRNSPSPMRSSLAHRRLHGPRDVSHSAARRAERRKTVTFDETCDVMEYDVDEDSADAFDWVTDQEPDDEQYGDDENENGYQVHDSHHHDQDYNFDDNSHNKENEMNIVTNNAPEGGFGSFSHPGNDNITGLVDSMLEDARPRTPTQTNRVSNLPSGMETEDGVPYGRTHHAERLTAAHHQEQDTQQEDARYPLPPSDAPETSTPTQSRSGTPIASVSPGSHIPLGRSTHSERRKAQREQEGAEVDPDVKMLPPSPSPTKSRNSLSSTHVNGDGLFPRFSLDIPHGSPAASTQRDETGDPFGISAIAPEPLHPDHSFAPVNPIKDDIEDAGHSDTHLSGLDTEMDLNFRQSYENHTDGTSASTSPQSPPLRTPVDGVDLNESDAQPLNPPSAPFCEPLARAASPSLPSRVASPLLGFSPHHGSPLARIASPLQRSLGRSTSSNGPESPTGSVVGSPDSSLNGRSPRISREEVQRRLMKKRSLESPLRELPPEGSDSVPPFRRSLDVFSSSGPASPSAGREQKLKSSVSSLNGAPPLLTRGNPTYDGIMALDPEPQPIDPPRPSLARRVQSLDNLDSAQEPNTFSGLELDFDKGGFGADVAAESDRSIGELQLGDMRSALDRLMEDVAGEVGDGDGKDAGRLKVEAVTQGVKAGRFSHPGSENTSRSHSPLPPLAQHGDDENAMDVEGDGSTPMYIDLPPRDPEVLLSASFKSPDPSPQHPVPPPIRVASPEPPGPPPKDAIRAREELIKAKKREARRREEQGTSDEEMLDYLTPPPRRPVAARPNRRRSMSANDVEGHVKKRHGKTRSAANASSTNLLDDVPIEDEEDPLADSIDRELRKLKGPNHTKYHVRQRSETIYATADTDHGSRRGGSGEVDGGKAWRTVRRASDMNEYAKQIKELRAQENVGKKYGKVFVRIVGLKNLMVPMPREQTACSITLNNGIHFVSTQDMRLEADFRVEQEFELIEHSKLEFTLFLKVRRDPHIVAQYKALAPPPRPVPAQTPPPPPPASKGGGMRSFFLGSGAPKKKATPASPQPPPPPPPAPAHRMPENLARYLTPDGTLAKTFICFKDIAKRCDTRLLESSFTLWGQKIEGSGAPKNIQIGEIVLQIFRLPPLPGIPDDQQPQSLEECHRGLRYVAWHKFTYFEGTLTQNGGDCVSWRRRHLRVIGANLVAFNDVTKRVTATIDLRKAITVEDDQELRANLKTPTSGSSAQSGRYIEFDGPYGVERAFRLVFPHNQQITFFADTDEEKAQWLEVLRALVGRIPPNPLWAELVWQKQQEVIGTADQTVSVPESRALVPANPRP